jgi:MazG family protein
LSHVPTGPVPAGQGGRRLLDLVRVVARLRAPDGCPWDRAQTHRSLRRHLLEETYELLDAIERGDPQSLREELGVELLQAVIHAQMAADEATFDNDDVAQAAVEKLIRRHPLVFAEVQADTPEQVYANWERLKAEEKPGDRAIDSEMPPSFPALLAAQKVQRRASGRGFDWAELAGAVDKVREELSELEEAVSSRGEIDREGAAKDAMEEEVGDVLFAVTALARKLGVDAESALRSTTRGFVRRFEEMESRAQAEGILLEELGEDELVRRFRDAAG